MDIPHRLELSIIIPTFNRRRVLDDTLPSVFAQTASSDLYEVVIVDDGSTDGTADAVRNLRPPCALELIEQPNRGPAAARNAGLRAARADLVLFLDDDIRCDPRLVEEHLASHATDDGLVIHGWIGVDAASPATLVAHTTREWCKLYYSQLVGGQSLSLPEDVFLIANSSTARSAVLDCGGFDEHIPFPREDFELGLRLSKAGLEFRYQPAARAYEIFRKSSGEFARKDGEAWGKAEVAISRKHPDYKPHSVLSNLGHGSIVKRGLRRALATSPIAADWLLRAPVTAVERLINLNAARRIGTRLLGIQHRSAIFRGACRAAGGWAELQAEFGRRLPVLTYHRVGSCAQPLHPSLTVSERNFERQVRWLSRLGFETITPSQWAAWRARGGQLPKKPVLLTFDDGYADLTAFALPLLRDLGLTAGIFVVSGEIGGRNSWDEFKDGERSPALLNREQIKAWARQGFEVGAHTRTHPHLSGRPSSRVLDQEIRGSKTDLEQVLAEEVNCFAYPFGSHDEVAREFVCGAFQLALTIEEGINDLTTDPFQLRRTMVQPGDSLLDCFSRLYLGFSVWQRLRERAVGLRRRLPGH